MGQYQSSLKEHPLPTLVTGGIDTVPMVRKEASSALQMEPNPAIGGLEPPIKYKPKSGLDELPHITPSRSVSYNRTGSICVERSLRTSGAMLLGDFELRRLDGSVKPHGFVKFTADHSAEIHGDIRFRDRFEPRVGQFELSVK